MRFFFINGVECATRLANVQSIQLVNICRTTKDFCKGIRFEKRKICGLVRYSTVSSRPAAGMM
jgi:hypothetical protein